MPFMQFQEHMCAQAWQSRTASEYKGGKMGLSSLKEWFGVFRFELVFELNFWGEKQFHSGFVSRQWPEVFNKKNCIRNTKWCKNCPFSCGIHKLRGGKVVKEQSKLCLWGHFCVKWFVFSVPKYIRLFYFGLVSVWMNYCFHLMGPFGRSRETELECLSWHCARRFDVVLPSE